MRPIKKELERRISEALLGGGEERIKSQHQKKKLTARERIEYFGLRILEWANRYFMAMEL